MFRLQRVVHHHRGRIPPAFEGRGIDDRFDRRAGLQKGQGVIELTADGGVVEVGRSDHGQDFAGVRYDHDHGRVVAPVCVQHGHIFLNDLFGLRLQVEVDGGPDLESAFQESVVSVLLAQVVFDVLGEVGCGLHFAGASQRLQGGSMPHPLRRRDVVVLNHLVEHVALAFLGLIETDGRVVERRRLRQAGQQRGLGQVQLAGVLVEKGLRGRFDAVRALPVENLIQVHRQDVLLGELPVELDRGQRLLEFAGDRDIEADLVGVEAAGQLLGDSRAARRAGAAEIDHHTAQNRHRLDPLVAPEGRVLRGHGSVDHDRCDLVERDKGAPAAVGRFDFLQQLAVAVVDAGGLESVDRNFGRVRQAGVYPAIGFDGPPDRRHGGKGRGKGSGEEQAKKDQDADQKETPGHGEAVLTATGDTRKELGWQLRFAGGFSARALTRRHAARIWARSGHAAHYTRASQGIDGPKAGCRHKRERAGVAAGFVARW